MKRPANQNHNKGKMACPVWAFEQQGEYFFQLGNHYSEAADSFAVVLDHRPNDVKILMRMAEAQRRSGHRDKAIREFSRVIELEPDNVEALQHLGDLHCQRREYKTAEAYYFRVIACCPSDRRAYFDRAHARGAADSLLGAASDYLKGLMRKSIGQPGQLPIPARSPVEDSNLLPVPSHE